MKKEVLVIFKTHLDIGFTDYSENVRKRYLDGYIPNAIKVGYELRGSDTPFVWTVGSWLIWQALKSDSDGSVERAIKDGLLRWHALPFTTHTELMNKTLFEYGVSISRKLDERFGLETVGAKMTDVPGHTVGMIPILKANGVEFLHLGVNPATPLPSVPPVFKWKWGEDEITVMYQGDYGEDMEFDDFIVSFAHTGDNLGPQSPDVIVKVYEELRKKYPNCDIHAATIDDLARRVRGLKELPVIEKEIGDTWIHGAGTDPQKMSRYRRLLREIEDMDDISADLTDSLLCVPEHTWGMDVKTHFPLKEPYTHKELEAVADEREKIERSWEEQRDYVRKAEELLGVVSEYPVEKYDLTLYTETEIPDEIDYEISWQLFDNSDYEWYSKNYMRCHLDWAIWDFTKVGLMDYVGEILTAKVTRAYYKGDEKLYLLEFDEEATEIYGLPSFYLKLNGSEIELKWFGKKASRLPQAFWFKIKGMQEKWQINKMGQWISPEDILDSNLICGIDRGVKNDSVEIESLDCALVAPYGRKLLRYKQETCVQDLYFNLYNNIWNTNFPIWYSDDAIFRFKINK
ncbi:MAG: DUF5054 domain-containing protein [Clostridia bacterium]|nr:DUF5054 domain-containing protein [Clostridia bacterium]